MSYYINRFVTTSDDEVPLPLPVLILRIEGTEDIAAFMQLIQQGSNLMPDLPASMKELSDLITVGHIQQDYRSQR